MINGTLAGGSINKNLPFKLIISTVRRKKLLDAIMSENVEAKKEGEKVIKFIIYFTKRIIHLN
jgi:centrin-1